MWDDDDHESGYVDIKTNMASNVKEADLFGGLNRVFGWLVYYQNCNTVVWRRAAAAVSDWRASCTSRRRRRHRRAAPAGRSDRRPRTPPSSWPSRGTCVVCEYLASASGAAGRVGSESRRRRPADRPCRRCRCCLHRRHSDSRRRTPGCTRRLSTGANQTTHHTDTAAPTEQHNTSEHIRRTKGYEGGWAMLSGVHFLLYLWHTCECVCGGYKTNASRAPDLLRCCQFLQVCGVSYCYFKPPCCTFE